MIEAERVQLLHGEPERVTTPSNSGKGQLISRCPTCRLALWSNYAGAGEAVRFLRVGTLDDRIAGRQTSTSSPRRSSPGLCCRRACLR
jgi:hypothetical protein